MCAGIALSSNMLMLLAGLRNAANSIYNFNLVEDTGTNCTFVEYADEHLVATRKWKLKIMVEEKSTLAFCHLDSTIFCV